MSTAKERPILFSGPMVRAILEGRKTMTRRVVNPQPAEWITKSKIELDLLANRCPYGQPGDVLWVRETFRLPSGYDDATPEEIEAQICPSMVRYLADGDCDLSGKNRPSIFMRRCWSRILLEVVSVRVELVREITHADAIREGCRPHPAQESQSVNGDFERLWDSINAKRGYGWDANPWVWVVEFKRVSP